MNEELNWVIFSVFEMMEANWTGMFKTEALKLFKWISMEDDYKKLAFHKLICCTYYRLWWIGSIAC